MRRLYTLLFWLGMIIVVLLIGRIGLDAVSQAAAPHQESGHASPVSSPSSQQTSQSMSEHGCSVRGSGELVLPDPLCTPGAVSSFTTAQICSRHYPTRPPTGYTEPLKRQDVALYGDYAGASLHSYELDHLVPLELGGDPKSKANLWPEYDAGTIPNPKDRVEAAAHAAVCRRVNPIPLATAQHDMATDWIDFAHTLRVSV